MKRWAILTVLLYACFLILLTGPLAMFGGIEWSKHNRTWSFGFDVDQIPELYANWGYWVWLVVLLGAQAAMLLVPVDMAERRPVARRRLVVPVVTASFLLANLFLPGLFSVIGAIWGDKGGVIIEAPAEASKTIIENVPVLKALLAPLSVFFGPGWTFWAIVLGMVGVFWMVWGLIFFRATRADEPEALSSRATRWLLRGSILELLIAIPSHIIVRQRGDCCAPAATFWGIVTGVSVMLLAFGPGVFFLFAERIRRKRGR